MNRKISLESLADGIPVVLGNMVPWYVSHCAICFDSQGHSSGVILQVDNCGNPETIEIHWNCEVDAELQRAIGGDLKKATDFAACAIVFCLVRELTNYITIEQAAHGTRVDYYLSDKQSDDNLIFNNTTARLEISGILQETEDNSVKRRISDKLKRLKKGPKTSVPTYVAVVEFGEPWSRMVLA